MTSAATCMPQLCNGDIESVKGVMDLVAEHGSHPTDDTRQRILPCKRSSSPSSPPSAAPLKKRTDYLSWEEYFMAVAFLSAQRSKDPNSQVGACIVNPEHKIVGIGYNGMPNNCSDDELPWQREAPSRLDTKYPYVCHAELNAILNKNTSDVKGCTIYVALFPCNECAKLVIQSGIAEVVFMSDKYHRKPEMVASRRLLNMAGIKYRQYIPTRRTVTIDFSCLDQSVYDVMQPYDTSLCVEETQLADTCEPNDV